MEELERKQVIVIRKDLNMRKGKMIAQGAHASLAAVIKEGFVFRSAYGAPLFSIPLDLDLETWLTGRFKKICVGVDSEAELLEIAQKAEEAKLHFALIKDSGLTEFGGVETYTTCAIGPNNPELIDLITGHLKLL